MLHGHLVCFCDVVRHFGILYEEKSGIHGEIVKIVFGTRGTHWPLVDVSSWSQFVETFW
jgi:hypothetical protein